MPNWNLKDDLRNVLNPQASQNKPIFALPLADNVQIDRVSITEENDIKKLVIDIPGNNQNVDVLAMGNTWFGNEYDQNNRTYKLLLVDMLSATLNSEDISRDDFLNRLFPNFDFMWFENWRRAELIPKYVIYENIKNPQFKKMSGELIAPLEAGDRIGEAGAHPNDSNKKQIKISIEYANSTSENPRFMHPKEFFSLLFWKEEYDPVFNWNNRNNIREYDNNLLKKMMVSKENGDPLTDSNGNQITSLTRLNDASQLDDLNQNFANNWLGLRPPLRTYKRVLWEAKREYLILYSNFANYWGKKGNLKTNNSRPHNPRIKNPKIYNPGYQGSSKCNIFAGEMAFRSGFRVFVFKPQNQNKLKYMSTKMLSGRRCTLPNQNGYEIKRNNISWGRKRCIQPNNNYFINNINYEISNDGKLFILAGHNSYGHVIILSEIVSYSSNSFKLKGIDQHCCGGNSNNVRNKGRQNQYHQNCDPSNRIHVPWENISQRDQYLPTTNHALIELLPGGDPTEQWGIDNLNCER